VETALRISAHLGNLEHLAQLFNVPGNQIQERQALVVLGTLIGHFDNLMIALTKRNIAQTLPTIFVVDFLGCLESCLDITALYAKTT
jgi:hypothetical protein